jgi:hypothetical protein
MVQCKTCKIEHDGKFGSGIFCSRKCSNTRIISEAQKEKVRQTLLTVNADKREAYTCPACGKDIERSKKRQKKYCNQTCASSMKMQDLNRRNSVESIWDLSSRTRSKVIERFGKGCCRCGWNEAACDLHHIQGRNIPDPHNHSNLALLCPNCHRLYHAGKIGVNDVVSIDVYIDDWKKYYYG